MVCLAIVSFISPSCETFNLNVLQNKLFPKLKIDNPVQLAQQQLPQSGGEIVVNSDGDLNGLKIKIAENSYDQNKQFTITSSKIKSHNLGKYFKPISPLIQIGNEGGYANRLMELTIPINLKEGEIPVGFFYNEENGALEGIPSKSYSNDSITLLTRHFMSIADLSNPDLKAGFIDRTANIIIGSIAKKILTDLPEINSGFEIGKDNWEFGNHGSYIAPGGHCAGQNMAAMWYYYEKKLQGEADLNDRFSIIPSFDYDNAIGYKFCSVIHEDLEWDGLVIDLFDQYIDTNQDLDLSKFYTIAATMLVTGEPQGIGIYRLKTSSNTGNPSYGGHDLICYKVDMKNKKLHICDPNWPKDAQEIILKGDKFEPYIASTSTFTSSYKYEYITFYAKTAYIEWDQIGRRYQELLDSTIGTISPNTFPTYQIWALEKNVDTDIANADKIPFVINNDTLRMVVECNKSELVYTGSGKNYIAFELYDEAGKTISIQEKAWQKYTLLKPGWNKIGIKIESWVKGQTDKKGNYIPQFIDFKWLKVYRSDLRIEPDPITGKPGENISMEAISGVQLPANTKYIWNFGDGTANETIENTGKASHIFQNTGEYAIAVELYNSSSNELIAKAKATANVANEGGKIIGINFKCSVHNVTLTRTDSRAYDGKPHEYTNQSFAYEASSGFDRSELSYTNGEYVGELINYDTDIKQIEGNLQVKMYEKDSLDLYITTTVKAHGICPGTIWLDSPGPNVNKSDWEENFTCSYLGLRYKEDVSRFYESYDKVYSFYAWPSQVEGLNMTYTANGIAPGAKPWSSEYISHKIRTDGIGYVEVIVIFE